jgi:lipopolysaccharide-induced tumor necrosis factor-alpha factor
MDRSLNHDSLSGKGLGHEDNGYNSSGAGTQMNNNNVGLTKIRGTSGSPGVQHDVGDGMLTHHSSAAQLQAEASRQAQLPPVYPQKLGLQTQGYASEYQLSAPQQSVQSPVPAYQMHPQNPLLQQQGMQTSAFQTSAFAQPTVQPSFLRGVPLRALNRGPAPVDCPVCGKREITSISLVSGRSTHVWAGIFFILFTLPCIPYVMDFSKDVEHSCSSCGTLLATWKRGRGTKVRL